MRSSFEYCKQKFSDKEVKGAEVGTYLGINATELLENWSRLRRLVCIDKYISRGVMGVVGEYMPRVTIAEIKSVDAAKKFNDNTFDFVYIDASHVYKDVMDDCIAWLPKVKPGGVLCGHDYDFTYKVGHCPRVIQAVNDFALKYGFTVNHDRPGLLRKSPLNTYFAYEVMSDWWVDV